MAASNRIVTLESEAGAHAARLLPNLGSRLPHLHFRPWLFQPLTFLFVLPGERSIKRAAVLCLWGRWQR